ncbi:hypothetical protein EJ04DRAFT_403824, partial [Polyplosphaeria fusca]
VYKPTVILNSTADWRLWYTIKKEQATRKEIWQYVNPETALSFAQVNEEPIEPQLQD